MFCYKFSFTKFSVLFFITVLQSNIPSIRADDYVDSMEQKAEVDYDWWRHAVFYQIYPRSFMDSNDDGIGDLKGKYCY